VPKKRIQQGVSPKWQVVEKNGNHKDVALGETTLGKLFYLFRILGTGMSKILAQRRFAEENGKCRKKVPSLGGKSGKATDFFFKEYKAQGYPKL
jgi:hypothetical protein